MESDSKRGPERAPPDRELVARFQQGNDPDGAFRELFTRYGLVTHAFFRRRIGNAEIAAELNQELYLSVLQYLPSFRGECSFRTWLFHLARSRLAQIRRRWRVHLDEVHDLPDALDVELRAGDEAVPDRVASRAEQVRVIRRCMAALSEVERAVVMGSTTTGPVSTS